MDLVETLAKRIDNVRASAGTIVLRPRAIVAFYRTVQNCTDRAVRGIVFWVRFVGLYSSTGHFARRRNGRG